MRLATLCHTRRSRAGNAGDYPRARGSQEGEANSVAQGAPSKGVDNGEPSWVAGGGDEAGILLQGVEVGGACKSTTR
jgi:hypothetical protein